jgi:hypothetical protein
MARPTRSASIAAPLLASAAVLLAARPAAAEQAQDFLAAGALFGFSGHIDTPVLGDIGGELSFTHYPDEAFFLGIGGFAQAQSVGIEHWRLAAGAQANGTILGLELGGFAEGGDAGHGDTIGLHLAPFVSMGFLSVAFRAGIPLRAVSKGPAYGTDLGMLFTVKFVAPLGGEYLDIHF